LHPDYTAAGLWYGITAAALLLLEVNGGSEMACAGWMAGWLAGGGERIDVLTT